MAYQISTGLVSPNSNSIEQEQEQPPSSNIFHLPFTNSPPTVPITPNISLGNRVVRTIRPNEIGIIESIILNKYNIIQNIWVNFNGTSTPYPPEDLRQVVVQ